MPVDARRAEVLMLAALEAATPAARAALLDRECGVDAELRQHVEELLAAHANPASILDRPAATPLLAAAQLAADLQDAAEAAKEGGTEPISLAFLAPPTRPGALGRLGHYEVQEVLGHGGFGIVLRAIDEKLQRNVAIKVMAPVIAVTSPARKRFLREARSAAAIRHENVVRIYAVEEQPLPFLVMEHIPGRTLQQKLDAEGPLDAGELLRLAVQTARGLAAAHAQGLIHRDIKPSNILLEGVVEPRVKIADFGLALAADDASQTQSGVFAGTPMYMSPEQAQGQKVDARADLFSLGSVLYTMLSGRPPFRAPSTLAVLRRVAEDQPRPIQEIIPEAPNWLCELIGTLHAKNPDDRFQTAQELAELLEACLRQVREHGPQAVPFRFPSVFAARMRMRRISIAVFAAAILASAFLLAQVMGGGRLEPTTPASGPQSSAPAEPVVLADPGPAYLNSAAYLPLSEFGIRKVADFQEVHSVSPEKWIAWAKTLEPGYVPIVIGDHAAPNACLMHGIAVKLAGKAIDWNCAYLPFLEYQPETERRNKAGMPTIQMQYLEPPGKGMHVMLLWVRDPTILVYYLGPPTRRLPESLADQRKKGFKPFMFVPCHRPNPVINIMHTMGDSGRNQWRLEASLKKNELGRFTIEAMKNGLFIYSVAAHLNEQGDLRFSALAWENPARLDWTFQEDLTTAEYVAELAKQKREGLRPVSVTSYEEKGSVRYAASWVRYATR